VLRSGGVCCPGRSGKCPNRPERVLTFSDRSKTRICNASEFQVIASWILTVCLKYSIDLHICCPSSESQWLDG
jgi:hypothetical protein